jgi:serine/threonine-protein kinase RsbW
MRTEIQVPSSLKFLTVVEQWLLGSLEIELGDRVDWARQSNRLRLVLAEAYSNVVRHAHKDRPHLPIEMTVEVQDRDLSIEIWDRGQGFSLETYLPPLPEAKQENGYGWLILNRLMDRVEYRLQVNGKNCLVLLATLPPREDLQNQG